MANDVAVRGNTALATGGANPWAEAAKGVESGAYLKFNGNDGRYSFGQDDEDLPEGSRVVADMETLAFGFICWVDSAVEEEVLVAVLDGKPPAEHELTDYGPYDQDDGWRDAASLSMVLESYGDDDQDEAVGTQLLWKTSTGGQVRQIRKLSGAYGRAFSQHPGEFPIIELGVESYTPRNKKHGKVKFSPMLKIVGWMTLGELEGLTGEPLGDEPDDEPEEETPRRGRKAAAEEEAPKRGRGRKEEPEDDIEDEEEEAPRRGRGRKAAAEDDAEDEAPKRGRGRKAAAKDEDEEEEEAPRRGRGRKAAAAEDDAEDEEQEEAPRRGRGRKAAAEDEDEDEEEAPRRGRGRAATGNKRLRNFD